MAAIADSDTKSGFSQLTEGIQNSSLNMLWPGMYPRLCQKMAEIGPVVFEIFDQMCCMLVRWGRSIPVQITANSMELFLS